MSLLWYLPKGSTVSLVSVQATQLGMGEFKSTVKPSTCGQLDLDKVARQGGEDPQSQVLCPFYLVFTKGFMVCLASASYYHGIGTLDHYS